MLKILLRKLFPNAIPKFHFASKGLNINDKNLRSPSPSAVSASASSSLLSSVSSIKSEEKTVLLLGWLGSNSHNLKKVIEYYSSRGINTISFIMPLGIPEVFRKSIENELCTVINENVSNKNIFAHVYSNNGTWVWGSLLQRNDIPKFEKVIFDSAAYLLYERDGLYKEAKILSKVVVSTILKRPQYTHLILTPTITTLLLISLASMNFIQRIEKIINFKLVPDFLSLNRYVRDYAPIDVDYLFIYSTGDVLIPFENIVNFQNTFKIRGCSKIQELRTGDDVSHTGSFFKYPNIVMDKLDSFYGFK